MNPKAGDRVHIVQEDKETDGVLLPEQNKEILLVKLDSGYNIGITKKTIKKITIIDQTPSTNKKEVNKEKEKDEKETRKNPRFFVRKNVSFFAHKNPVFVVSQKSMISVKTDKKPESQQKNLPLITILHTGGTIACKVDYKTGAVVAKFTPEGILNLIPELNSICRVRSVFVANVQSESMRFGHYNLIAKAIEKELKEKEKPKGIIITHGTDTMHYSAAALSFMLENIDVPIILVGAQRSSDRGSSDSAMNVVCAARFIAQSEYKGVALCMHKNMEDIFGIILPACKSRKLHTSRRDAFKPVNTNSIAEVAYKENIIKFLNNGYYQPPAGKLSIKYFKETIKVGLFKTHTNTYPEDYAYFKNHEGLIIEGTGLGHAQTTGFDDISKINEKNKQALAEVCKKAVVVLTSQCIFGRVNMNIYSPQRELLDIGVIPGDDITAETALIKLAWLLSNYSKQEAKESMRKNLRGEITERSLVDDVL